MNAAVSATVGYRLISPLSLEGTLSPGKIKNALSKLLHSDHG